MYKRYMLNEPGAEKKYNLGGVVNFFIFCAAVVWLLPVGIEAYTNHPAELAMMPPAWRAEILCTPAGSAAEQKYTYTYDGECHKVCKKPGCDLTGVAVTTPRASGWEANLAESREGLDLYDVFEGLLTVMRYGTLLCALISVFVMRVGRAAH